MNRGNLVLCALLLAQITLAGFRFIGDEDSTQGLKRGLLTDGLKTDHVTRIFIESSSGDGEAVTLERATSNDGWRVVESSGYPADDTKVDNTLRELAGLEIADVVSTTNHHHVDFKVADSEFEKRVTLEEGDKKVELLFGTSGRANSVHVRRAGQDTVYAVRDYSSWRLSTRPDSWIDKAYFEVDEKRIVTTTVKNDNGSFQLVRHVDDSWTLRIDDGGRSAANRSKVESFLSKINRITMSKVAGREGDDGLDMSKVAVELVVGLATPPKKETKQGEAEVAGEVPGISDSAASPGETPDPIAVEDSRTLRITPKADDDESYLMSASGSPFIAQVGKWVIGTLLDAKAEDFFEKKDGVVEVDDDESR